MKVSVLTPAFGVNKLMLANRKLLKGCEFLVSDAKPIARARNELLKQAKGDYVLWLDSDIELVSNILPELFRHLKGRVIGVSASSLTVPNNWKNSLRRIEENVFRNYAPKIHEARSCMFECALFKKNPLIKAGGFKEEFTSGEDNDLCERLIKHGGKLLKLRDVTANHYYNSNNIGRKMRWYGAGERLLEKRYGKYNYAEFPLPPRKARWALRFK